MKFNPVLIIVLVIAMFIMYRRYSEGLVPMISSSAGGKYVRNSKYLGNLGDSDNELVTPNGPGR
jgi:hypothetical protein